MAQPAKPEIDDVDPAFAEFTGSEITVLAHYYRAEIYRSTIWRQRLDTTTNWSVVTTGLALSLVYSTPEASPFPMLLVGILVTVFLLLESERYRYFNVWRARCRLLETDLMVPMLRGEGMHRDGKWNELLANDLGKPHYHVSFLMALGRRLRKNYFYIYLIQAVAYFSKVIIHPDAVEGLEELFGRAAVGPLPGSAIIAAGVVFHGTWIIVAIATWQMDLARRRGKGVLIAKH